MMRRSMPRSSALRDALDQYGKGRRLPVRAAVLSRRAFLGTVGATQLAGWSSASLASAATDVPKVSKLGGILSVRYRSHEWLIDERRFGARAQASFDISNGVFTIRLKRASIPGTTLSADFMAEIWNPGNGWLISLRLGRQLSDGEAAGYEPPLLESWLSGQTVLAFSPAWPILVGQVTLEPSRAAAPQIELTCTLDPRLRGSVRAKLPMGSVISEEVVFTTSEQPSKLLDAFTSNLHLAGLSRVEFVDPRLADGELPLATTSTSQALSWQPRAACLQIEAFVAGRQRDALVLLGGDAVLRIDGPGLAPNGGRIALEKSLLCGLTSRLRSEVDFVFRVARCPFLFETAAATLQLKGLSEAQFQTIRQRRLPAWRLSVLMTQAHVPVRGATRAVVDFPDLATTIAFGDLHASTPARDALRDRLAADALSGQPASNCEAAEERGTLPPSCDAFLRCGRDAVLQAPLDTAVLSLQRSADNFDMKFEFRNYRIEARHGASLLTRRWAFSAGCPADPNPPTLIAIFPPQHLQEEVFTVPEAGQDKGLAAAFPRLLKILRGAPESPTSPQTTSIDKLVPPDDLARTLIAAPTRIAMQSETPRSLGGDALKAFELTVESITDWHGLALAVHQRALPRNPSLRQQLQAVGLTPDMSRSVARHTLFSQLAVPPSPTQTAIEPVTGLVVSPDSSAWFETPRSVPVPGQRTPLWSARLRLREQSAVRVIHARGANLDFLSGTCALQTELQRFVATLTSRDRAELLVMMSAFGLPALRRLQRDEKAGNAFRDDPKGMVMRPDDLLAFLSKDTEQYKFLDKDGKEQSADVLQEGILVPRPYTQFELTLSSLKAVLRSRWDGEPPAPLRADPFFETALNIEGYIHRTMFGRDMLVQVAYKGFLFPLGHRAALIKVSERKFLPACDNPDHLYPTAYLVQRHFIVCRQPKKAYPALGQPFLGREFPAASVEMLTIATPDILNVDDPGNQNQGIDLSVSLPERGWNGSGCEDARPKAPKWDGRVFWPRTRPGRRPADDKSQNSYGNEIEFEYRIDGSGSVVKSPLIFVDNTAAHDPRTMEALAAYYEGLPYEERAGTTGTSRAPLSPGPVRASDAASASPASGEDKAAQAKRGLRMAALGNTSRRYAPGTAPGQTNFDTDSWVLGASGMLGSDQGLPKVGAAPAGMADAASFTMDALMEGADQPPFYPRVERAFIKMQSLDRLLGRPQGLIEVGFSERYVRHALDRAGNPAEIYLDVIRPAVDLDVSGQGEATGGIAKPNARLAAISRIVGLVGGRPRPAAEPSRTGAVPSQVATPAVHAVASNLPTPMRARGGVPAGIPSDALTFDTSAAQAGRFDPAEFLGGALSDALLLGVIPLRDVVQAISITLAPKLEEVTEYGEDALQTSLRDICSAIGAAADAAMKAGNDAIRSQLGILSDDPIGECYPAVARPLRRLSQLCLQVSQLSEDDLGGSFRELAGQLVVCARDVLEGIEEVATHPMPKGLDVYVQRFRVAFDSIARLGNPQELKNLVIDQITKPARAALVDLLNTLASSNNGAAFDMLFGLEAGDAQARALVIREILEHPQDACRQLERTLFHETFGRPLLTAWMQTVSLVNQVSRRLSWSRRAMRQAVADVLGNGDPALREAEHVLQVAEGLVDVVERAVNSPDLAERLSRSGHEALSAGLAQALSDSDIHVALRPLSAALELIGQGLQKEQQDIEKGLDSARERAQDKTLPLQEREKSEQRLAALTAAKAAVERRLRALATMQRLAKDPRQLLDPLRAAVRMELKRRLVEMEQELRSAGEELLEQVLARILSGARGLLQMAEQTTRLLQSGRLAGLLADWCNGLGTANSAASVLKSLITLLLKPSSPIANVRTAMQTWLAELASVSLPSQIPAQDRVEMNARLAALRRTISECAVTLTSLDERATTLSAQIDKVCTQAGVAVRNLAALFELRRRSLEQMRDIGLALVELDSLAGQAPAAQTLAANWQGLSQCSRLREMLNHVLDLIKIDGDAFKSSIVAPARKIDSILGTVGSGSSLEALALRVGEESISVAGEIRKLQELIDKQCKGQAAALRGLCDAFDAVFPRAVAFTTEYERKLVAAIFEPLATVDLVKLPLGQDLAPKLASLVRTLSPVLKVYGDLVSGLGGLIESLKKSASGEDALSELFAMLARPGLGSLERASSLLEQDQQLLVQLEAASHATPVDAGALLATVAAASRQWDGGEPGLVAAARILQRLLESLLKGQFGAFFDLSGLRRKLEEEIAGLLPTRVRQKYTWSTRLDDFPANDPVFQIDRGARTDLSEDLTLEASIEVDLVKNVRRLHARGRMRPFKIRLLGDRLDLVTISFGGASFEAGTGIAPTYDASITGVEIGAMLEFIKGFQPFFSPAPGNGPYVALQLIPPELQAGYRYATPMITVGALSLLNVGIAVSMHLPFDNRPAYFKFSFASRELPFLICAPPYGGGGFVGLLATAKGIIGFEIQFEFGAIVALKFGPMSGVGRVMAGVYLLSNGDQQVLEGFVTAAGEGNIACFGIAVNICVRVRQESGGAMVGSSTYSFSFKVGFASISRSFTAQYSVQGGTQPKTKSGPRSAHVAALPARREEIRGGVAALQEPQPAFIAPQIPAQVIRTRIPRKERNWAAYRSHVAI